MTTEQTKELNLEACRIIEAMGGTNTVAELFKIKPPSVSDWKITGIPDARLFSIKLLRPDLFKQAA